MKCQAKLMALEVFGDEDLDPCGCEADVEVSIPAGSPGSYRLCDGCLDSLKIIIDISTAVVRRKNEEN